MAKSVAKKDFLYDLHEKIREHCETVTAVYKPLTLEQLTTQPDPKEWNILQCFDHLNLTHDYYNAKIKTALDNPAPTNPQNDVYKPSFFGRIYMHFAFNPNYSFSVADEMAPDTAVSRDALTIYLHKQDHLLQTLSQVNGINLAKTKIPISTGVNFNLGDCLKILVYHDALHLDQARRILKVLNIKS